MGRDKWEPQDFGIDMPRKQLIDMFLDELRSVFRGMWTIDELVVHPREAGRFCEDFRLKTGFYSLPDDIILRTLMQERKVTPASHKPD